MFDIGWTELLVVGAVVLFIFGPQDIPKIMYGFGRIMRRFRYMRYALSSQFEDFMEKTEKTNPPAKQTHMVQHDDEMDADEHLIDMMPIPENVPEKFVEITDKENDTPPANTAG